MPRAVRLGSRAAPTSRLPPPDSDPPHGVSVSSTACATRPPAREILLEASPDRIYRDQETGESWRSSARSSRSLRRASRLPWAVENLRFCNWCDQMAQKDLNDCPTCGRRMAPLS